MKQRFKKRAVRLVLVAAFGLLVSKCGAAAAEFYADRYILSGRMTVESKCWVKGSKSRTETTMGKEKRIIINRPDKGILWMLDPVKKEYVERKNRPAYNDFLVRLVKLGGKKRLVGTETVSGQKCDKYSISFPDKKRETTVVWVSRKLNHPIKVQTNTETVIYDNIKVCKLSNSLFEVPKGYTKK